MSRNPQHDHGTLVKAKPNSKPKLRPHRLLDWLGKDDEEAGHPNYVTVFWCGVVCLLGLPVAIDAGMNIYRYHSWNAMQQLTDEDGSVTIYKSLTALEIGTAVFLIGIVLILVARYGKRNTVSEFRWDQK